MNTDKIYAEQLANEYAPKDTSAVVALRKLDARAKLPAHIVTYTLGVAAALLFGTGVCPRRPRGRCRNGGHGHQLPALQTAAGKRETEICL